jgi:hypothetical protein
MAEKYWYRVVIRKKSEYVTDISALRRSVITRIRPLSVSVRVKRLIFNENRGLPGSLHAIIPTSERTKSTGREYHANSFFTGRPAAVYIPRIAIYRTPQITRLRVRVTSRITSRSPANVVHGLTREKNVSCRWA